MPRQAVGYFLDNCVLSTHCYSHVQMASGEHEGQQTTTKGPSVTAKCRIAEILQYSCDWSKEDNRINCLPFPRIFRMSVQFYLMMPTYRHSHWRHSCPGRPAVEITRQVNVDIKTGEVEIPPEVQYAFSLLVKHKLILFCYGSHSQFLPKGKPWRDVVRYPQDEWSETPDSETK